MTEEEEREAYRRFWRRLLGIEPMPPKPSEPQKEE